MKAHLFAPLALLFPFVVPQEPRPLEIDRTLLLPWPEGHGGGDPVAVYRGSVAEACMLYVWLEGEAVDPRLGLWTHRSGFDLEDDDSGGGRTAFVAFPCDADEEVELSLYGDGAGEGAALTLTVLRVERADSFVDEALAEVGAMMDGARSDAEAGDWDGAREMGQAAIDVLLELVQEREVEEVHKTLWEAGFLAKELNDPAAAVLAFQRLLVFLEEYLPPDHPNLQAQRLNLAAEYSGIGDLQRARELEEQVLAVRERTLPAGHPDVQLARINLAMTLKSLGLRGRAQRLEREALAALEALADPPPRILGVARLNLAGSLREEGDLEGARALLEASLEEFERTDAHPRALAIVRGALGGVMQQLGDRVVARELKEQALVSLSTILPPDHADLHTERVNLGTLLYDAGEVDLARQMFEESLKAIEGHDEEWKVTLALQARANLAMLDVDAGEPERAYRSFRELEPLFDRVYPESVPRRQIVRMNLAGCALAAGDLEAARALLEEAHWRLAESYPEGNPHLRAVRRSLVRVLVQQGEEERALELGREHARELRATVALRAERDPPREVEALGTTFENDLSVIFSLLPRAGGDASSGLEHELFCLLEELRQASLRSYRRLGAATEDERLADLRDVSRFTAAEVARLSLTPSSSDDFLAAVRAMDVAERELLTYSRSLDGDPDTFEMDAPRLLSGLREGEVAIGYRALERWWELGGDGIEDVEGVLVAWLASPDRGVQRVELCRIEEAREAVAEWLATVGAPRDGQRGIGSTAAEPAGPAERSAGERVRALLLDPLLAHLAGDGGGHDARRFHIVPDDALHLVPFGALPAGGPDSDRRLGDRSEFVLLSSLIDLLDRPVALPPPSEGTLLLAGDLDYGGPPRPPAGGTTRAVGASARVVRSGVWASGFERLPGAAEELERIRSLAREHTRFRLEVLTGMRATKEVLAAAGPGIDVLHLATHGYFAPESIPSTADPVPLDARSELGLRTTQRESVRGLSPMLLCGLALSGADGPPDAFGRLAGVMTAEELSTLDLSRCRLAVLSACQTHVGEPLRAGQGIASLQKALQLAGARQSITSLWPVSDEATLELMTAFYRHLWRDGDRVERALWRAKASLRDSGLSLVDWAGWVLSGDPG